tara:strand:+ start:405 stop:695 length:291 start_codon:yes stop_codon:yes gene_type:complete
MNDTKILSKKLNDIEKMMWEDRKFFISVMIKLDRVVKFVSDLTDIEEAIFGADNNKIDEEKMLKAIMEDLNNDMDNKREEFIKYHKMINSDQVGES